MSKLERIPTDEDRYVYAVDLVRVIDGDTVVLDLDLGVEMWQRGQHCRLIGINAPEPHTETREAGLASAARLRELLSGADHLLARTHFDKVGSFRRLLVELWADGMEINQRMVDEGHAVEAYR